MAETPSPLFEEWRTLYAMEPWADERADEAAGTVVAAVQGAAGIRPRAAAEYMRFLRQPEAAQSEEEMRAVVGAIARMAGGHE